MGYQVILAPSARRNLREIVRYISLDSPTRAAAFSQFLVSSTRRVGDFPMMGRIVPELKIAAIRELRVRSYRVIYRIDDHARQIHILRFWHVARGPLDLENES